MNDRNPEIDLTKGVLTIGMVFNHIVQILGDRQSNILEALSHLTNLVSYSGFLFCFGFALWIAYLQDPQRPWFKVLKTTFKCYFAFIISGIAARVLMDSEKLGLDLVIKIATIRDFPAYSEFLFAFAVITILGATFQKIVRLSTKGWQNLLLSTIICLAFTFSPGKFQYDPFISQFIGGQGYYVYPTIQYLPLFLLGVFSARYPEWFNMRLYLIASIGGMLLLIISVFFRYPLVRFPPSAAWILCSAGLFCLYLGFARIIHAKFPYLIKQYINAVGQNVLTYLLLSNLVLFTCAALGLGSQLNTSQLLVFFTVLMGCIFFIQFISVDLYRANQSIGRTDSHRM